MPADSSHSNSRKYILLSYLRSRSDSEAGMTMSSILSDYPSNLAAAAVKGLSEPGHDPPNFKRSINPISTRGGRLCSPHYYLPPPQDFQTFLRPFPQCTALQRTPLTSNIKIVEWHVKIHLLISLSCRFYVMALMICSCTYSLISVLSY